MTPLLLLAEKVEGLRKRIADATPSPWVYRPDKYDDWGWIRGPEKDSDIGRYRPIVANAKNSDVGFEDMQSYRDAGIDPYGANAMLIVEGVNILPELLNTLELLIAENAALRARAAMEAGE